MYVDFSVRAASVGKSAPRRSAGKFLRRDLKKNPLIKKIPYRPAVFDELSTPPVETPAPINPTEPIDPESEAEVNTEQEAPPPKLTSTTLSPDSTSTTTKRKNRDSRVVMPEDYLKSLGPDPFDVETVDSAIIQRNFPVKVSSHGDTKTVYLDRHSLVVHWFYSYLARRTAFIEREKKRARADPDYVVRETLTMPVWPVFVSSRFNSSIPPTPPVSTTEIADSSYWSDVCPPLLSILDFRIPSFRLSHVSDVLRKSNPSEALTYFHSLKEKKPRKWILLLSHFKDLSKFCESVALERVSVQGTTIDERLRPTITFRKKAAQEELQSLSTMPKILTKMPYISVTVLRFLFAFRYKPEDVIYVLRCAANACKNLDDSVVTYLERMQMDRTVRNGLYNRFVGQLYNARQREIELIPVEKRSAWIDANIRDEATAKVTNASRLSVANRGKRSRLRTRDHDRNFKFQNNYYHFLSEEEAHDTLINMGFEEGLVDSWKTLQPQAFGFSSIFKTVTEFLSTKVSEGIYELLVGEDCEAKNLRGRIMSVCCFLISIFRYDFLQAATHAAVYLNLTYTFQELQSKVETIMSLVKTWISKLSDKVIEYTSPMVDYVVDSSEAGYKVISVALNPQSNWNLVPFLEDDHIVICEPFHLFCGGNAYIVRDFDIIMSTWSEFVASSHDAYVSVYGSEPMNTTSAIHSLRCVCKNDTVGMVPADRVIHYGSASYPNAVIDPDCVTPFDVENVFDAQAIFDSENDSSWFSTFFNNGLTSNLANAFTLLVSDTKVSPEDVARAKQASVVIGGANQSIRFLQSTAQFGQTILKFVLTVTIGFNPFEKESVTAYQIYSSMVKEHPSHCRNVDDAKVLIRHAEEARTLLASPSCPNSIRPDLRHWISGRELSTAWSVLNEADSRPFPFFVVFGGPAGAGKSIACDNFHKTIAKLLDPGYEGPIKDRVYTAPGNTVDKYWEGYRAWTPASKSAKASGMFAVLFNELFTRDCADLSAETYQLLLRLVDTNPFYPPMAFESKHQESANPIIVTANTNVQGVTQKTIQAYDYRALSRRIGLVAVPLRPGDEQIEFTVQLFHVASRHLDPNCTCSYCRVGRVHKMPTFEFMTLEQAARKYPTHASLWSTAPVFSTYSEPPFPRCIMTGAQLIDFTYGMIIRHRMAPSPGFDDAAAHELASHLSSKYENFTVPVQMVAQSAQSLEQLAESYDCEAITLDEMLSNIHISNHVRILVGFCTVVWGVKKFWDWYSSVTPESGIGEYQKDSSKGGVVARRNKRGIEVQVESGPAEAERSVDAVYNRTLKATRCLNAVTVYFDDRRIVSPAWTFGYDLLLPAHMLTDSAGKFHNIIGVTYHDGRSDNDLLIPYVAHYRIPKFDLCLVRFGGVGQRGEMRPSLLTFLIESLTDPQVCVGKHCWYLSPSIVDKAHHAKPFIMTRTQCVGVQRDHSYTCGRENSEYVLSFANETTVRHCGSSYWMPFGQTFYPVGFHVAGSTTGATRARGYAVPVTREMILSAIANIEKQIPAWQRNILPHNVSITDPISMVNENAEPESAILRTEAAGVDCTTYRGIPVEEYAPRGAALHINQINKIKKTPLFGIFGPATQQPSHLRPVFRDGQELCNPEIKMLRGLFEPTPPMPDIFVEAQPLLVEDFLTRSNKPVCARPLTIKESIIGCAEIDRGLGDGSTRTIRLGPMDLTTAVGYPYCKRGITRRNTIRIDHDTGKVFLDKQLLSDVKHCIDLLAKGVRPDAVAQVFYKQENLTVRTTDGQVLREDLSNMREDYPCGLKDTRTVFALPYVIVILCRMYFGQYAAEVNFNFVEFDMVGLNPHSPEHVQKLIRAIDPKDIRPDEVRKVVFSDFANWDGTLPDWVMVFGLHLINLWYDDGEENARIRSGIFSLAVFSVRLFGDKFLFVIGRFISGFFPTTSLNNVFNYVVNATTFYKLFNHRSDRALVLSRIRYLFCGDDNATNPRLPIDIHEFAATIKELFGMTVTNDAKTGPPDYITLPEELDKFSIVSRNILIRNESFRGLVYHMPLDEKKLINSLYYTVNLEQLDSSLRSFFIEATHHGRDKYEAWRKVIDQHPFVREIGFRSRSYELELDHRLDSPEVTHYHIGADEDNGHVALQAQADSGDPDYDRNFPRLVPVPPVAAQPEEDPPNVIPGHHVNSANPLFTDDDIENPSEDAPAEPQPVSQEETPPGLAPPPLRKEPTIPSVAPAFAPCNHNSCNNIKAFDVSYGCLDPTSWAEAIVSYCECEYGRKKLIKKARLFCHPDRPTGDHRYFVALTSATPTSEASVNEREPETYMEPGMASEAVFKVFQDHAPSLCVYMMVSALKVGILPTIVQTAVITFLNALGEEIYCQIYDVKDTAEIYIRIQETSLICLLSILFAPLNRLSPGVKVFAPKNITLIMTPSIVTSGLITKYRTTAFFALATVCNSLHWMTRDMWLSALSGQGGYFKLVRYTLSAILGAPYGVIQGLQLGTCFVQLLPFLEDEMETRDFVIMMLICFFVNATTTFTLTLGFHYLGLDFLTPRAFSIMRSFQTALHIYKVRAFPEASRLNNEFIDFGSNNFLLAFRIFQTFFDPTDSFLTPLVAAGSAELAYRVVGKTYDTRYIEPGFYDTHTVAIRAAKHTGVSFVNVVSSGSRVIIRKLRVDRLNKRKAERERAEKSQSCAGITLPPTESSTRNFFSTSVSQARQHVSSQVRNIRKRVNATAGKVAQTSREVKQKFGEKIMEVPSEMKAKIKDKISSVQVSRPAFFERFRRVGSESSVVSEPSSPESSSSSDFVVLEHVPFWAKKKPVSHNPPVRDPSSCSDEGETTSNSTKSERKSLGHDFINGFRRFVPKSFTKPNPEELSSDSSESSTANPDTPFFRRFTQRFFCDTPIVVEDLPSDSQPESPIEIIDPEPPYRCQANSDSEEECEFFVADDEEHTVLQAQSDLGDSFETPTVVASTKPTETLQHFDVTETTLLSARGGMKLSPNFKGTTPEMLKREFNVATYIFHETAAIGDPIIQNLNAFSMLAGMEPVKRVLEMYKYFSCDGIHYRVTCLLPPLTEALVQLLGSPAHMTSQLALPTWSFYNGAICGRTTDDSCVGEIDVQPMFAGHIVDLHRQVMTTDGNDCNYDDLKAYLSLYSLAPPANAASQTSVSVPIEIWASYINPVVYMPIYPDTITVEAQGVQDPSSLINSCVMRGWLTRPEAQFFPEGPMHKRTFKVRLTFQVLNDTGLPSDVSGRSLCASNFASTKSEAVSRAMANIVDFFVKKHPNSCIGRYCIEESEVKVPECHSPGIEISSDPFRPNPPCGPLEPFVYVNDKVGELLTELDTWRATADSAPVFRVLPLLKLAIEQADLARNFQPSEDFVVIQPQSDDDEYISGLMSKVMAENLEAFGFTKTSAVPQAPVVSEKPTETTTVESVATTLASVAQIASAFLDKPNAPSTPKSVFPRVFANPYGSGPEDVQTLAMAPILVKPNKDILPGASSFAEMKDTDVYIFANSRDAVTDQIKIPIDPKWNSWQTTSVIQPVFTTVPPDPHVAVCAHFLSWRGTIHYKVRIISPSSQRARIQIALLANHNVHDTITAVDLDPSLVPNKIIDVQGHSQFTISVPWLFGHYWRDINFFDHHEIVGTLVLRILDGPVTAMDLPNPNIRIFIQRNIKDVSFSQFLPWQVSNVPPTLLEREEEHVVVECQSETLPPIVFEDGTGVDEEGFTTLDRGIEISDILKKPRRIGTFTFQATGTGAHKHFEDTFTIRNDYRVKLTAPGFSGDSYVPGESTRGDDAVDFIPRLFMYYSGSFVFQFVFHGPPVYVEIYRKVDTRVRTRYMTSQMSPCLRQHTGVNPVVEFAIPWTSTRPWLHLAEKPGYLSDFLMVIRGTSTDYDTVATDWRDIYGRAEVNFHYGDDIRFGLLNPPDSHWYFHVPWD